MLMFRKYNIYQHATLACSSDADCWSFDSSDDVELVQIFSLV